jgi:hypothetical protein
MQNHSDVKARLKLDHVANKNFIDATCLGAGSLVPAQIVFSQVRIDSKLQRARTYSPRFICGSRYVACLRIESGHRRYQLGLEGEGKS